MTCLQTISQASSKVSGKVLSEDQSLQGGFPREVLGTLSYDSSELGP